MTILICVLKKQATNTNTKLRLYYNPTATAAAISAASVITIATTAATVAAIATATTGITTYNSGAQRGEPYLPWRV